MKTKMVRENAKGFVLADVVLGMFILVVALTAIGGLYIQSSKTNIVANNRTVAYNWAQERMEILKSTSGLQVGTEPEDNGRSPRAGFTRKATLVAATIPALPNRTTGGADVGGAVTNDKLLAAVNAHLIHTTVTVSWTENGMAQSVQLETLIEQK